jgi:hypothetical protein
MRIPLAFQTTALGPACGFLWPRNRSPGPSERSVSRGEQTQDSDVDLLVDLAPGRTLLDLAAFRRQAREILGVPVDVATADMLKERIRNEALMQAKRL